MSLSRRGPSPRRLPRRLAGEKNFPRRPGEREGVRESPAPRNGWTNREQQDAFRKGERMRRMELCLTLCLASALTLRAEEGVVAVKAGRLLDVKSGAYVANPVVVVRGDRIESVGTKVPPGATVEDLGDRTLLPGLIDAHTHILLQGDATVPEYHEQILQEYPAHRVARAVRALKIALEHGFTALRDLETEGASYS